MTCQHVPPEAHPKRVALRLGVGQKEMRPTETTREFWLMMYAMDAFRDVIWACDHLIDHKFHPSTPSFRCLVRFIVTNYSRPFHRNRGIGSLPSTFVPAEYIHLHEQLIEHRNKMYAHIDGDGPQHVFGAANQVRLSRLKDSFLWSVMIYLPYEESDLFVIRDLCNHLISLFDQKTSDYESVIRSDISALVEGEYILVTDLGSDKLFHKVGRILPEPQRGIEPTPL